MTRNKTTLIATLILLCLGACAPKRNDYSGFVNIDTDCGWPYAKALTFDVEHPDSIVKGRMTLTVRHTDDYLYSNLWLEVSYDDPLRHNTDTVNIVLADIYGNWTGKGSGVWKQQEVTIADNIAHRSGDRVKVRHIMRTDTLRAIDLIGISFTEND